MVAFPVATLLVLQLSQKWYVPRISLSCLAVLTTTSNYKVVSFKAINDAIIGNQNDGAGDGVQDANANGEKLQNGPVHVQPVPPLNNQDNKKVVGGDYGGC